MRVIQAEHFESLSLVIELPGTGHVMMINGTYHPPKPIYKDCDLIHYLLDVMDNFSERFPTGVIAIGGDLNNFDLDQLSTIGGLSIWLISLKEKTLSWIIV